MIKIYRPENPDDILARPASVHHRECGCGDAFARFAEGGSRHFGSLGSGRRRSNDAKG